jgi:transcriptional regulator with XRE-family HTH domain
VWSSSSSAQQALQAIGSRLHEIRVDARLTGRELGTLAGWHPTKVSKIEHGRQRPSSDDIRAWCALCGAGDQVVDLIASLRAVDGMFVEWRRMERAGLRQANESAAPLYERTRRFRIYSSWVVPGPVQTGGYIAAVLHRIRVRRDLPDDVDATVRVRLDRQRVVHQGDHRFAVVLEESVLRNRIGGAEAMAEQLRHLITVSRLPSVSLGVIPLDADRSAGWPIESFWMFDDERVCVELVSGYLTVTQPREIAMYA